MKDEPMKNTLVGLLVLSPILVPLCIWPLRTILIVAGVAAATWVLCVYLSLAKDVGSAVLDWWDNREMKEIEDTAKPPEWNDDK